MKEMLVGYLWEQVLAERLCAARMDHVLKSEILCQQDRRDLESLTADERNHAQWLRDCLPTMERGRYPGTWGASISEHIEQQKTLTPEEMIVTVYLPERHAVRTLARQAELFREDGDVHTAACYEQILGEERRHVEVTSRVMRNVLHVPRVRQYYHDAVKGRYRQYHYDFLKSR